MSGHSVSVADLFRELQETNRLLRALASQKAVEQAPTEEALLPLIPAASSSSSQTPSSGGTHPPSTPGLGMSRETARQLVDDLAHAVFSSRNREHLEGFRDQTLSLISRPPEPRRDGDTISPRHQVRLTTSFIYSPDPGVGPGRLAVELLWNWRANTVEPSCSLRAHEVEQLQQQWPVQFDLDRLTQAISRDSGWILGRDARLEGAMCAFPLLYGPDRKLVSAHAALDVSQKDGSVAVNLPGLSVVSPGSLW